VPCTTIHKALSPTPNTGAEGVPAKEAKFRRGREEFGFGRNESTPLEDQIIVIDECSMVDVKLMASFLRAVKPGTRLIIVGDPNQLPSVGAGSVLRDLLAAGVPHVELTQIRRSDGGGRVVRACHAIKDGRVPEPADEISLPTENWIHIELSDPNEIAAKITDIHRELKALGADPMWDVQAISAQRGKLAFGCDALNGRLSSYLNCPSPIRTDRDDDYERIGFRPGDKIVRTANGVADELRESDGFEAAEFYWRGEEWKASPCPVVNGDMGEVLDIVTEPKPGIVVRFRDPERLCRLPLGEHNLVQAYAMTVHKCQGSGFPFVVVPVHQAFYWDAKRGTGLFSRELLYTAISRAERLLVTVGQWSAVVAAVGRKTVHQRQTTLAARLKMQQEGVPNVPF
jgi:exodeoxyribonuclease V alpha subunit